MKLLSQAIIILLFLNACHKTPSTKAATHKEPSMETPLKVVFEGMQKQFHIEDLKKLSSFKIITVEHDEMSGGQRRAYLAVSPAELFQSDNWNSITSLQFVAKDGMSVRLSFENLKPSSPSQSEAWLAIKPEKGDWPKTRSGHSIAPFYLVWLKPELSHIGPEQWPYQVVEIRATKTSAQDYPQLMPKNDKFKAGYSVFLKNCLPCHTLNKVGDSKLGPDLNRPHSPTEYFKKDYLKKYIRDPKALRDWPQHKMPSFDKKEISNQQLDQLIEYLEHMAQSR